MECILLGTGGMMPMPYRMLTAMAVKLEGGIYLFDGGEGIQINWKRLRIGVRVLGLLAVTHLHADHCLGIPGLMMLKAQSEDPAPLTILGPPGIREFILQTQRMLEFRLNYPVDFVEWSEEAETDLAYRDERVRIFWRPLDHTRFCLGYRMEELDRPGRFDPQRAEALGAPMGHLWGKLQRGESIVIPDGSVVAPEQVLGPPRRGRHIAFVVDTRPTPNITRLCRDVDLAFIEGMFTSEHSAHAAAKAHMTVAESARIAGEAGAKRAVIVHISPRYGNEALSGLEMEARDVFENARIGKDMEIYPVSMPGEEESPSKMSL